MKHVHQTKKQRPRFSKKRNKWTRCHPRSKRVSTTTCIQPTTLEAIKRHVDPTIHTVEQLATKHQCDPTDVDADTCLLKRTSKPIRQILLKDFRPLPPDSWRNKPNEWLSNEDILKVLRQYEEAYPAFHFIGPSPIDFDTRLNGSCVWNDLCQFSVEKERANHKKYVAIVFNLDRHDQSGSHWTAMFIDLLQKQMFYFDSAHNDLPPEIDTFHKRVAPDFAFFVNRVQHQQSNTECGMYSLFFIIEMLSTEKPRKTFFSRRFNHSGQKINDAVVEKFRRIYFLWI